MNQLKEMEERIPKVSDVIRIISELESLDLKNFDDEELAILINNCFPIIQYSDVIIPKGSEIFRARLHKQKEGLFEKVQDIFVREENKITSYGRAHKPKERIFYSSANPKIAVFEIINGFKNDLFIESRIFFLTIGTWKVQQDLHLASILFDSKLHDLRKDIHDSYIDIQQILKNNRISEDALHANNLITEFFCKQFTKMKIESEHDYKISAFYTKHIRQLNELMGNNLSHKFDGINYPSVANDFKGDNQAIFIESSNKIKLVKAQVIISYDVDFKNKDAKMPITHESQSIIDDKISWKKTS